MYILCVHSSYSFGILGISEDLEYLQDEAETIFALNPHKVQWFSNLDTKVKLEDVCYTLKSYKPLFLNNTIVDTVEIWLKSPDKINSISY